MLSLLISGVGVDSCSVFKMIPDGKCHIVEFAEINQEEMLFDNNSCCILNDLDQLLNIDLSREVQVIFFYLSPQDLLSQQILIYDAEFVKEQINSWFCQMTRVSELMHAYPLFKLINFNECQEYFDNFMTLLTTDYGATHYENSLFGTGNLKNQITRWLVEQSSELLSCIDTINECSYPLTNQGVKTFFEFSNSKIQKLSNRLYDLEPYVNDYSAKLKDSELKSGNLDIKFAAQFDVRKYLEDRVSDIPKKQKIALIIATPAKGNSGMLSVDLSGIELLERNSCEYDILCVQDVDRDLFKHKIKKYTSIVQLNEYSHVIFWGDFINNIMYGLQDFTNRDLAQGISVNANDAFNRWLELFTLGSGLADNIRVAAIGGNFHFCIKDLMSSYQSVIDELQIKCSRYIQNLQNNFDLIQPRDTYSLLNLANYFDQCNIGKLRVGLDCAFLYNKFNYNLKSSSIYYFFHRSKLEPELIKETLQEIKNRYGLDSQQNYNWLSNHGDNVHATFKQIKMEMASARLVITDTYHFAINCLTSGTIAICIGNDETMQVGTLGDFKKMKLYEHIDLMGLYIKNSGHPLMEQILNRVEYVMDNYTTIMKRINYINEVRCGSFEQDIINFMRSSYSQ